jgi:hypothetical protein
MEVKQDALGNILVLVEGCTSVYRSYPSRVDALLGEALRYLGITKIRGKFPAVLNEELKISRTTASRVRSGKEALPITWILKLQIWSGMPLADLEALAGVSCGITPWPKGTK